MLNKKNSQKEKNFYENKMASIGFMVRGAVVNALAFSGSIFLFSSMASSAERARHDKALEKLQYDRDKWNQSRLERIDFINEQLKKQDHAEQTFSDVDDAMRYYYETTVIKLAALPPEPELQNYLDDAQLDQIQKTELGIVVLGMLGTSVLVYRYL